VGNGNTDVGNKTATRKPGRPIVERLAGTLAGPDRSAELRTEAPNTVSRKRSGNCGAMSQQCGDSGNFSTPQKFVQLVGCREPKTRPEPSVRPGPAKR
jgi:hypothetical protein